MLGLAGVGVGAATDALSSADATTTDGALSASNSASNDGTLPTTTTDATDSSTTSAACAGGLSFSADTLVQTPSGEKPIASLQVGEHVTSYDPTTGKATTQTITHVFVNHDTDRLDVTLALPATSGVAPSLTAAQNATVAREQRALTLSHGRRGPPDTAEAITSAASSSTAAADEVIHTTANHPWLTADRGWQLAGALRVGEPVRLLDGRMATMTGLHAVAGVGAMWDLSLDATHTFAVGVSQAVVHNTGPCSGVGVSNVDPSDPRAFAIADWSNYPTNGNVSQPEGPFKLLQGPEYQDARIEGNAGARAYGNANNVGRPYQSHHIQPIQFGGAPRDANNLMPLLSPWPHQEYTNWWNGLRDELIAGDYHRIQFLNPNGHL